METPSERQNLMIVQFYATQDQMELINKAVDAGVGTIENPAMKRKRGNKSFVLRTILDFAFQNGVPALKSAVRTMEKAKKAEPEKEKTQKIEVNKEEENPVVVIGDVTDNTLVYDKDATQVIDAEIDMVVRQDENANIKEPENEPHWPLRQRNNEEKSVVVDPVENQDKNQDSKENEPAEEKKVDMVFNV